MINKYIIFHGITLSVLVSATAYILYKKKQVKLREKENYVSGVLFFTSENAKCRLSCLRTSLPCGAECSYHKLQEIICMIDKATLSLELCMYIITVRELAAALVRAHYRGVLVRVIVDEEMISSSSKVKFLRVEGIPIRCKRTVVPMHHKSCIIDGASDQNGKLLMGSLNWTVQGFAGNFEDVIITSYPACVKNYSTEFNKIWELFSARDKNLFED